MAADNRTTFHEYLQSQNYDQSNAFDSIMAAAKAHNDYRTLSLIFVDTEHRDTFERLWYEYEGELDRQNYERELSLRGLCVNDRRL